MFLGHLTDHRLLVSFIRSLFVPHRTKAACAVQKLEDIASSQPALHSKVNTKVDPLLQAANTLGMAAALQGDTQNGANECAQCAALQGDTQNVANECTQGAALQGDTQNGATECAQGAAQQRDTPRTQVNVHAYSQCAAADGAVAGIETPSSCKSTPGPTRQRGKRGGRRVRQQQAAKTLLALLEDMSQPQANLDRNLDLMHVQTESSNEATFGCYKRRTRLLLWR